MKNIMNKLGLVAIIAALSYACYMALNNRARNPNNVKIQIGDIRSLVPSGNYEKHIGDQCLDDSNCQSHSCQRPEKKESGVCVKNEKYPSD